ncbi:MAG: IS110 family transposase [Myxococcales bacterium]|nr:IS110 family transposase [Myxococcales bacterium]
MILLTELGDLRRFKTPRQLMSYVGIVPGERSSGESVRRTGITKTGNAHVRRALVEAAWGYRSARTTRHSCASCVQAQPRRSHPSPSKRRLVSRAASAGSALEARSPRSSSRPSRASSVASFGRSESPSCPKQPDQELGVARAADEGRPEGEPSPVSCDRTP